MSKISRPVHDVNFTTNLARGEKVIGGFYFIFHGCSNKTYASLVSTLTNPILIKQRRKSDDLSS